MSAQHPVAAQPASKVEMIHALLLAVVLLITPVIFAIGLGLLLGPVW